MHDVLTIYGIPSRHHRIRGRHVGGQDLCMLFPFLDNKLRVSFNTFILDVAALILVEWAIILAASAFFALNLELDFLASPTKLSTSHHTSTISSSSSTRFPRDICQMMLEPRQMMSSYIVQPFPFCCWFRY
jgi:hypothetical protein